ncbi:TPA: DUF4760 domain-containing protein [Vibrio cholerae]|nr:DUF4760 domain-containing protein [Vibrio cholerae]
MLNLEAITAIGAIGAICSGLAALIGIFVAYKVHLNQKLLSQRQLLLPLWEHICKLHKIDPEKPITPHIIQVVNTLELVALCCEGGMVDEQVIRRTFKNEFLSHCEAIKRCKTIPGRNIDGEALLKENKAALQFYKKLDEENLSSDKIRRA